MKLYMFRTGFLSIIRSFSLYTRQCYMSYRFADSLRAGSGCSILILHASCQKTSMTFSIAVCTVKNSWWWTEELSETCRVSFQEWIWEISSSSWVYYKKFNTMYGHTNFRYLSYWIIFVIRIRKYAAHSFCLGCYCTRRMCKTKVTKIIFIGQARTAH